jgi:uncharacterized membrane protein
MKEFTGWLIARLNERSTWTAAIPTIGSFVGIQLHPDQAAAIATVGMLVASLLTGVVPNGTVIKIKD